jgi:hypothetical protein
LTARYIHRFFAVLSILLDPTTEDSAVFTRIISTSFGKCLEEGSAHCIWPNMVLRGLPSMVLWWKCGSENSCYETAAVKLHVHTEFSIKKSFGWNPFR